MNNVNTLLAAGSLMTGYTSGSGKAIPIAGPLAVEIHAGQLICLLGPNGSGKSTLLRTLAGLQSPLEGTVRIAGTGSGKLKPAQLARKISLVLTDSVRFSNLTVYSLVALGRYPYSNWLGVLSEADKSAIAQAIDATGIESFLQRKVATLSDGESQKVMLARALAQDTPLMMLDEPTAHLDLPSRIQLMQLLHQLVRQTNKGILISTHELDLALQVADEVWLLQPAVINEGGLINDRAGGGSVRGGGARGGSVRLNKGAPEDLVLNGTFEAAFDKEGVFFDKATGVFRIHQGNGKNIALEGEGASVFWTRRALERQGFTVVSGEPTAHNVRVVEENGRISWVLGYDDQRQIHESIAGLLNAIIKSTQ